MTIATGARIITHDNAISKPCPEFTDLFGRVFIKRNSFIGAYSVLLPGITIGENVVVAAGSVVTKSIPDGEVWGGVPARKISTVDIYAKNSIVTESLQKDCLMKKKKNCYYLLIN